MPTALQGFPLKETAPGALSHSRLSTYWQMDLSLLRVHMQTCKRGRRRVITALKNPWGRSRWQWRYGDSRMRCAAHQARIMRQNTKPLQSHRLTLEKITYNLISLISGGKSIGIWKSKVLHLEKKQNKPKRSFHFSGTDANNHVYVYVIFYNILFYIILYYVMIIYENYI